jgi:hypothetical protein
MVTSRWDDLAKLANMAFERETRKLKELKATENQLAKQRVRLADMNEAALKSFGASHPSHWHNGDFLWQEWVGQNKRALGMEQAKLRALTEMHKPQLRKAFGRKTVLDKLAAKETH